MHHDLWFEPTRATLFIVGDATLDSVLPKLEARLGRWRANAVAPVKAIPPIAPVTASVVYLIDKPGAQQTVISAAEVAPARRDPDELAIPGNVDNARRRVHLAAQPQPTRG